MDVKWKPGDKVLFHHEVGVVTRIEPEYRSPTQQVLSVVWAMWPDSGKEAYFRPDDPEFHHLGHVRELFDL